MRAATLALAVCAALALAPAAATAEPILLDEDANELAQTLADATEVQGVCYGWHVAIDDASGLDTGVDEGSTHGPGRRVDTSPCDRSVELVVSIVYTSETSESEDSATWTIQAAGVPDPPTIDDLADLGYSVDDLMGDQDDTTLVNAVGALPGLVADRGQAEPVPFVPERQAPGAEGVPTNRPGSDFLRENGTLLAVLALVTLAGAYWLVTGIRAARRDARPAGPLTHD